MRQENELGRVCMLNCFHRLIANKKGFVSILAMLLLGAMLPLFLFALIEIQYLYALQERVQHISDRASAAAAYQTDQNLWVNNGMIRIQEEEAIDIAKRVIDENIDTMNSLLKSAPTYTVSVVNDVPTEISINGEVFEMNHPFVLVTLNIKPNGVFFKHSVDISSISIEQVVKDGYGMTLKKWYRESTTQ